MITNTQIKRLQAEGQLVATVLNAREQNGRLKLRIRVPQPSSGIVSEEIRQGNRTTYSLDSSTGPILEVHLPGNYQGALKRLGYSCPEDMEGKQIAFHNEHRSGYFKEN